MARFSGMGSPGRPLICHPLSAVWQPSGATASEQVCDDFEHHALRYLDMCLSLSRAKPLALACKLHSKSVEEGGRDMKNIARMLAGLFFFSILPLTVSGQVLDNNLRPLEPLLKNKWAGFLRAPDGSEGTVHLAYESLAEGRIVKFRRDNFERKVFSEGYFYWDALSKNIASFSIGTGGNVAQGFVKAKDNVLIIEGKTVLQKPLPPPSGKQTSDFRIEWELTADGKLIERNFQNATGTMQPGHVIEFQNK
jgi:hypothetical protein